MSEQEKTTQERLQEQVDFIAKQCELLVEDPTWYEDYTNEEREQYDKACETLEGEIGVGAYFQDVYDIQYRIHSSWKDKGIDGVRLCVACGGPNIYVDTYQGKVIGDWWMSHAEAELSDHACDLIEDYFTEILACTE